MRGALHVGVDAEARVARDRVGEVELPVVLELLALVVGEDRVDDLARVGGRQLGIALERREAAADADHRRRPGGQVKVGRVAGDDVQEQVGEVEGHVPRIDLTPLALEGERTIVRTPAPDLVGGPEATLVAPGAFRVTFAPARGHISCDPRPRRSRTAASGCGASLPALPAVAKAAAPDRGRAGRRPCPPSVARLGRAPSDGGGRHMKFGRHASDARKPRQTANRPLRPNHCTELQARSRFSNQWCAYGSSLKAGTSV